MAPFVIPGVTLEEVLGACKATRGRDLYRLAATASKDLADYVRARREDGDLEPVKLGGAPASAPPTEAGAPSHPSPATVSRSTPVDEDLLNDAERAVRGRLETHRGEWHSPRGLAAALDLKPGAVTDALRTWRLVGVVEHNGRLRTAARYRIPLASPAIGAAIAGEDGGRVLTRDEAEAKVRAQDDGGDRQPRPSRNGVGPVEVSARTRRALEREAREKAQAEAGRRRLGDGSTLEGRLTVALGRRIKTGGTIPELATELRLTTGDELRDLIIVIAGLEDRGELERRGRRGPKGHVVYAVPDRLIDVT